MAPRTVKKTAVAKEVDEDKPKETRPKRNKPSNLINKETENDPIEKNIEVKPKGRGRGRKAQLKPNEEISDPLEDVKMEPIEPPVSSKRKAVKTVKDDKEKPSKKKAKASNKAVKNADIEPNEEAEDVEEKHAPGKENDDTEENQNSIEKVPVPNKKNTENVTKKARKGGKKAQAKVENNGDVEDENAKGDTKVEEEMEEEVEEAKPVKSKRGQKKVVEKPSQPQEEVTDTVIPSGKRRRKVADDNGK
ncbi:resistance to inhibitors of cholinesterase protein 3-like [Leptidea sinapis]|uniref:resistance to inhibitors of cholinesterase protein 3-like n=1 Tax=Leptidea sinapis TaxID=189913 RepID=UPI0021C2EC1A|nr:resistance to inhibitors of cholinesterase protein 3-like [Leptidea sinapis]